MNNVKILDKKLSKKADTLIIILTYNSIQTTRYCLNNLKRQADISYDILLIDNGGNDYKKLSSSFPELNYIVPAKNLGTAGAYIIGVELGLKHHYKFIVLSVNDVVLMNTKALSFMKTALMSDPSVGAVVPHPYVTAKEKKLLPPDTLTRDAAVYTYFFVKAEVFKVTGLHDFALFLCEDLILTSRIAKYFTIKVVPTAFYYCASDSPGIAGNTFVYYTLRALVHFLLHGKAKSSIKKIAVQFIVLRLGFYTMLSIKFKDFSFIYSALLGMIGGLNLNWKLAKLIPANKYSLAEVNYKPRKTVYLNHSSLLKKNNFYYVQNTPRKRTYYQLKLRTG